MDEGGELSITYGAKPSCDLFRDYGFAMEENREPDGSSNEVVRIDVAEAEVEFRAPGGGASYTYFCVSEGLGALRVGGKGEGDGVGLEGGQRAVLSFDDFDEVDDEDSDEEDDAGVFGEDREDLDKGEEEDVEVEDLVGVVKVSQERHFWVGSTSFL